jgi:hypothetical protein
MEKHSQKLDSLQSLLGPPAPPPPLSPMARLLKAMRVVMADPIVQQLRQQRGAWMNRKLSRLVVETIAVETQDAPELGRKLCHWILRPNMKRPGVKRPGLLVGSSHCDAVYDTALKVVAAAKKTGSRRVLRRLSHLDEEFVAMGIRPPHACERAAPGARIAEVINTQNKSQPQEAQDTILDYSPQDFLFDAIGNQWYQRDARGEWMGPYSDSSFSIRLLTLGLPRNKQDGFKAQVPQYDRAEPLFDKEDDWVKRHGVGVRNTYVKTSLTPEIGSWFAIHRVLLNLTGGNTEYLDFLLDWIAAPLQSLHREGRPLKMRTAIVLHGDEGAGKGTLERILKLLYGSWNVAVLGQNALESRFHEQLIDKLFVVANEVISSTNRSAETQNLLKPWVTDDEIPLEGKHKAATKAANRFNIMFTSNDEKPVIVPKKDRRYTVFKTGPILPQKLSEVVHADLDGPQLQVAAFFEHLLRRKVKVKVGKVLDTEARREVQAATATSDEKFVAALKEQGWWALSAPWADAQRPKHQDDTTFNQVVVETKSDGPAVLSSRLNEVYRDFCHRNGLKARDATLLGKMVGAEFPEARAKEKKIGGVVYRVWFGLPMMSPTAEADVIPLPITSSPAANTGQPQTPATAASGPSEDALLAGVAVDNPDFGAGAA